MLNTKPHPNLCPHYIYHFLCTILPLYKRLYTAAMPNSLLLGITCKNVSAGAVVGRGKIPNTFSENKVLIFV